MPVVNAQAYASLFTKVYTWMALALALTGLTAYYVAGNIAIMEMLLSNSFAFWGLVAVQLGLVWGISGAINRISFPVAGLLFVIYSILNGVTLSFIFLAYTMESIASVFFITAGAFGGLSLVGYFIKRDLSAMGKFLLMALIGIIIASVVNIFLQNSTLHWVVSYLGVLVFAGLTAYDTQKIKNMLVEASQHGVTPDTQKIALIGSLTLYLDFINLFLYLLRIFGDRR
ncbi:MAG: Bax inhibitor-1/YccA family protein [Bacteroidales bacterium]|nr:Bax inhibitor-1/YccA family protein [Bacteroidales bacterium]